MLMAKAIIRAAQRLTHAPCSRLFAEKTTADTSKDEYFRIAAKISKYCNQYQEKVSKPYEELIGHIASKKVDIEKLVPQIVSKQEPKEEEYKKCYALYTTLFSDKRSLHDPELTEPTFEELAKLHKYVKEGCNDINEENAKLLDIMHSQSSDKKSSNPSIQNKENPKNEAVEKDKKSEEEKAETESYNAYKQVKKHIDEINEAQKNIYEPRCVYKNLGIAALAIHNYEEAIKYFNKSNAENQKITPLDTDFAFSNYSNISLAYSNCNKFQEELEFLNQAAKVLVENKAKSIHSARMEELKGMLCYKNKMYEEAIKSLQVAYQLYSKSSDVVSGIGKMDTQLLLGNCNFYMKSFKAAIRHFILALPGLEKAYGKDSIDLNRIYSMMGICYYNLGNYKSAAEYFQNIISINQKNNIVHDEASMLAVTFKIYSHLNLKEFTIAQKLFEEFRPQLEKTYNTKSEKMVRIYRQICGMYLHQRETAKAEELINLCEESVKAIYGAESTEYFKLITEKAMLLILKKMFNESEKSIEKLHLLLPLLPSGNGISMNDICCTIGMLYHEMGSYNLALKYLQRYHFEKTTANSKAHAEVQLVLGQLYYKTGDYSKSWTFLKNAKKNFERLEGINSETVHIINYLIALDKEKLGKHDEAIEIYQKCKDYFVNANQYDIVASILHGMARIYTAKRNTLETVSILKELYALYSKSEEPSQQAEATKIGKLLASFGSDVTPNK